jgi:hypothetical protein
MPLDPSIPLQAKGVQLATPESQLNMMASAAKLNEYNRSVDEQNALRDLIKSGVDIKSPEARQKMYEISPEMGIKFEKSQAELNKSTLEGKKLGVEVNQKTYDYAKQKMADLSFNPSDNNIKAHLEDGVLKGEVTPQQAQATWQAVSVMKPEQRKAYFTDLGMKVDERAKLAEQSRHNRTTEGISYGHLDVARQGLQQGAIPAGYRKTAEGNLEAIPGGPTTTPLAPKELQTREAKYPMATQAVKTVESKADKLITDIETLKNHPGLDSITGAVYGRTPSVTAEGRAAQALYDSIVARGGFQELAAMRAASPTGGALGNVSNQEGQQLKDAFGTLNRTQNASDLRTQLARVADDVRGAKTRVREAYDMTYDYKASAPSATPAPSGKDDPLGIR